MDMPSQGAKDLQELEALGSSPSCSPSWVLARRLPSSHHNTKLCLEIHVMLTEELGTVPLPSHSWTAPLWKICCMTLGLASLKQWVQDEVGLFFTMGRHSLGESLTADKARDATYLLTRAGTLVEKLAYLATDPMTIQEG